MRHCLLIWLCQSLFHQFLKRYLIVDTLVTFIMLIMIDIATVIVVYCFTLTFIFSNTFLLSRLVLLWIIVDTFKSIVKNPAYVTVFPLGSC